MQPGRLNNDDFENRVLSTGCPKELADGICGAIFIYEDSIAKPPKLYMSDKCSVTISKDGTATFSWTPSIMELAKILKVDPEDIYYGHIGVAVDD